MNYRRYFRHAMMLTLATGLLASCSKDNNSGEPDSGINNALVAITPEVSFVTENNLSETYTPSGPVDGTENLTLYFIKANVAEGQEDRFEYGDIIAANRPADNGDNVPEDPENPYYEPLTFEDIMYYPVDGSYIRMWGMYPEPTTYESGSRAEASWTFNGSQDIIIAKAQQGNNQNSRLMFSFEHILTQLQFFVYTETDLATNYWGKVQQISIESQDNLCKFTIDDGDYAISRGRDFKNELNFDQNENTTTFSVKGEVTLTLMNKEDLETADTPFPAMMIAPIDRTTSLTFKVKTEKQEEKEVTVETHIYNAGEATRIYLNFLPGEIIPTLTAGKWEEVNVNVELGEYPYVRNGKYIVSKDLLGYSGEPLHENWSPALTPNHIESSESNRVSAILEIAEQTTEQETTNWYEAAGIFDDTHNSNRTSLCPEGWRLPTIKELELIYSQNDRLSSEFRLTSDAMYWSSTTSNDNPDFAHIFEVAIDADRQANKHKTDNGVSYKVRCVRDI